MTPRDLVAFAAVAREAAPDVGPSTARVDAARWQAIGQVEPTAVEAAGGPLHCRGAGAF